MLHTLYYISKTSCSGTLYVKTFVGLEMHNTCQGGSVNTRWFSVSLTQEFEGLQQRVETVVKCESKKGDLD